MGSRTASPASPPAPKTSDVVTCRILVLTCVASQQGDTKDLAPDLVEVVKNHPPAARRSPSRSCGLSVRTPTSTVSARTLSSWSFPNSRALRCWSPTSRKRGLEGGDWVRVPLQSCQLLPLASQAPPLLQASSPQVFQALLLCQPRGSRPLSPRLRHPASPGVVLRSRAEDLKPSCRRSGHHLQRLLASIPARCTQCSS